jgi:hypothetical protein
MMRMIALYVAMSAAPALAQGFVIPPPSVPVVPDRTAIQASHYERLRSLRKEIIAQRDAEGGVLSQASRDRYQLRLDALETNFRRQMKKADRSTINLADNSWG